MDDDLLQEMEAGNGPSPTDRARRRRLATTVAICGLAFIGFGQLSTGAFFTDQADASLQYVAGDVKIMANGQADYPIPPAAFVNRAPGDVSYVPLTISNAGALDLKYAITGNSSGDAGSTLPLSGVLTYNIYSGVPIATCTAKSIAGGTLISTPADTLISTAGDPITGVGTTALVGNPATGVADPADRTLSAGAGSEPLCVTVTFPKTADNNYADGKVGVKLFFFAQQVANNP